MNELENELDSSLAECIFMSNRVTLQVKSARDFVTKQSAEKARPHLRALFEDSSHLTAEQLQEIASVLSPVGVLPTSTLGQIISSRLMITNKLLLAAIYYYNWHRGEVGCHYVPDPALTEDREYDAAVTAVLDVFDEGTRGDPRRILTGADLEFFDSLPDRFTIYRGAAGVTPKKVAAGLCWSTRRDVAEQFARRGEGVAVVVAAECRKSDVRIVSATESEIVTLPTATSSFPSELGDL